MKRRLSTALLFLFFCILPALSQEVSNSSFCGTDEILPIANYQDYSNFVNDYLNQSKSRSQANLDTIPVQLYMFSKTDGSEQGDPQVVIDALSESNAYFRKAGFIFHICEQDIAFINDDYFFEYNVDQMTDSIRRTYNKNDALELYVVNTVGYDSGRTVSGIGSGISFTGGFTVCGYNAVSVGLFVHEFGHCMHLAHTHGKYNFDSSECDGTAYEIGLNDLAVCKGAVRYDNRPDIDENNDGISDCHQTGDNVCDTPADPQLGRSGMLEAFRDTNGEITCNYIGTERDPYGDLYNPLLNNFMAYGKCGELDFTDGQLAKMRYALENSGLHFLCGACSDNTEPITRTVTTIDDGKVGSLRWALSCASLSNVPVTVQFDLPGNDSIIYLKRSLPSLSGTVKIDGRLPNGNRVVLDGGLMEQDWGNGFIFEGNALTIENLKLQNFPNHGVFIFEVNNAVNFKNCEIRNCSRLRDWGSGITIGNCNGDISVDQLVVAQNKKGISIGTAHKVSFKNMTVQDNGNTAISVDSMTVLEVNNLLIENNEGGGMYIGQATNAFIDNCQIKDNKYDGINIDSLGNIVIENTHLTNNSDGIAIGIADSVRIRYSSVNQGKRNGIGLELTNNVILENVEVIGNTYTGIFAGGSENVKLYKLTINNNESTGINLKDFKECQIDSLSLDGNGSGLYFQRITNISLHNTNLTNHKFKAINGKDCGHVVSSNLLVENNAGYGFEFNELATLAIHDIEFNKNGRGIYIQKVDSVDIHDVNAIGNTGLGFSIVGILDAKIQRVKANQNEGRGIYLGGEGNILLTDVEVKNNTGTAIEIKNVNDLILKEIVAAANEGNGIIVNQSRNIISENIQIEGSKYKGIGFIGEEELFLRNVVAINNGFSGLSIENFSFCSIDSVFSNQNSTGLYFKATPEILLSNFTANNNSSYGIDGHTGGELMGQDITILNNQRDGINIDSLVIFSLENSQLNENNDGIYIGEVDRFLLENAIINKGKRVGINLQNANMVELKKLEVIANKNIGVSVKNGTEIVLHKLIVNENEGTGISLQGFTHCQLDSLSLNANNSGLSFKDISNIHLHNTNLTNHQFKAINGIDCGNLISNNLVVENNGGYGLHFNQLNKLEIHDIEFTKNSRGLYIERVDSVNIRDVMAVENQETGFSIAGVLVGNIEHVQSINNQGTGIYLRGDGDIVMNNATIKNNKNTGVYLQDFKDSKIMQLQINSNTVGLSLNDIQRMEFDSLEISENRDRGVSGTDLGILDGANIQIANNGSYGIYINSVEEIKLTKSVIDNNERGFNIKSIVDLNMSEVDITNNKGIGLSIDEVSTANLSGFKSSNNTSSGIIIRAVETIDMDQIEVNNNEGTGLFLTGKNTLAINDIISNENDVGINIRNFISATLNNTISDSNRIALTADGINSLQLKNLHAAQNSSKGVDCLNGNLVQIENSEILNNGGTGLTFNKINKITLTDSKSNSNAWTGIYIKETLELDLNNLLIDGNEKYGLELIESSNLQLANVVIGNNGSGGFTCRMCNTGKIGDLNKPNWFYNNGGSGIAFSSGSTNIDLFNNQIGLDQENNVGSNQVGISITSSSNNIRIGGEIMELKNKIANHPQYGITISSNVYDAQINVNEFYCNDNGIIVYSGGNSGVKKPTINSIVDRYGLSGTADSGSKVSIYKTSTDCTSCEGETFLVKVTSNGEWRHIFAEPMEIGDKFTVISTNGKNSSSFSACRTFDCSPSFQPSINNALTSTLCEGDTLLLAAEGGKQFNWSNGFNSPENEISTPGTYEVTVTGEYGCQTVVSHEVILEATPDFSISDSGNESDCAGIERTLSVLGGLNYLWDTGDTTQTVVVKEFREYAVTVSNNGCSKNESILVKGQTPTTSRITQSICQGVSFENYSETGIYENVFTGSNGCDSTRVLELEVLSSSELTVNKTICAGEEHEGYKEAGVYEDTFLAYNGCDSVRTLVLEILPTVTQTTVQTICAGTSFEGYTTTGVFQDAFTGSNGCDSIRMLELLVIDKVEHKIDQIRCAGEAYLGYTVSGIYEDTFTAASGCDSTRILDLTILSENKTNISQSICEGENFEAYTTSGVYTDTFTSSNGCDSTRTITLTVLSKQVTEFSKTLCTGEEYEGYKESGVYEDTFSAFNGCDSLRILVLDILSRITNTTEEIICAGTSFENYSSTGVYEDVFTASNGCDSLRILELTVVDQIENNFEETICVGETYLGYQTSGRYEDRYTAASGCDSIRTLELIVLPENKTDISQIICEGDTYEGYASSGTYTDSFMSQAGCDSVRTLTLMVEPVQLNEFSRTICDEESFEGYTKSDRYVDVFQGSNGCDSTRILNLIVKEVIETREMVTICEGTTHEGYAEAGIYQDTYTSQDGCDSIRILTLEVTEVARINEDIIICEGENYNGYFETGEYVEEYSSNDCDTIYNLNLEVVPKYEVNIEKYICTGQSYEGYSESGEYTDTFLSVNGCDSIRHLQLISGDRIIATVDTTICNGESVEGYFEKGSYIDIFQSQTGCDSLRILEVYVLSAGDPQCLMTATIDLDISNYISVFPNPIDDVINIEFLQRTDPTNFANISIFNTQGALQLNCKISLEDTTLSVGSILPTGLYILQIEIEENQYLKKIIKL